MTEISIVTGDFTISRTIAASNSKVFRAFAEKDAKRKWFFKAAPDDEKNVEYSMDFREGGTEIGAGRFHDGTLHIFKATYFEIIPDRRIIYAYEMFMNDTRISVSIASIEMQALGDDSCQLTVHESGVFLDGADVPEQRQRGTEELMTLLAESVEG